MSLDGIQLPLSEPIVWGDLFLWSVSLGLLTRLLARVGWGSERSVVLLDHS